MCCPWNELKDSFQKYYMISAAERTTRKWIWSSYWIFQGKVFCDIGKNGFLFGILSDSLIGIGLNENGR